MITHDDKNCPFRDDVEKLNAALVKLAEDYDKLCDELEWTKKNLAVALKESKLFSGAY